MSNPEPAASPSRLRAYLELLRLPNVFTAMADVLMGYLVTHVLWQHDGAAGLLLAASACLYLAGMVLNDVFDYAVDLAERPGRPLPSGRLSLPAARALGVTLLVFGVLCGWLASWRVGDWASGGVATVLAGAVVLYDWVLKRTPLGPLAMGSCRFLNVLLGMSAAAITWQPALWQAAAGIGVYITGVTWFARSEATQSSRGQLSAALVVMLAGLGLLAALPAAAPPQAFEPELFEYATRMGDSWYLLWALLALSIAYRAVLAISQPVPARVQMAVKHAIMSLVVLDAAVTFAARGIPGSMAILVLLIPMVIVGQWIYST